MFNPEIFRTINRAAFGGAACYPHMSFARFLLDDTYAELLRTFPARELFEEQIGIPLNVPGRRPHDRHYMCFSPDRSTLANLPTVDKAALPPIWQEHVDYILRSEEYLALIRWLFGVRELRVRIDWHQATAGQDVSPHTDSVGKLGTHLFYYNDADDWDESWGGQTLILGELRNNTINPEISDFAYVEKVPILGNKSYLFQNTPHGWHSVDKLTCPAGRYRKLCAIVFLA